MKKAHVQGQQSQNKQHNSSIRKISLSPSKVASESGEFDGDNEFFISDFEAAYNGEAMM